ncbi:MAG TPA: hypothetical protein VNN79_26210, partial [Actinomycetota bacterium]|nr:hypothetical protein [Actinomycetota bacterium]
PDGTRIAFSGVVPDPARTACSPHCGSDVYVMNADGTDLHDIAPWPKNQAEGRWSPDGNWIATSEFSRQSSGPAHDRVFIVHPDGSGRLEASGSAPSGPSFGLPLWSPGRAILAWPANEVSVHGLAENGRYEFDPATGNIRFVNLYAGDGLAWQPLPCTAWGTSGNDVVAGTVGDDVLCGLAGNDTFDPRGGNDVVVGGAGDDTVTYRRSPAGIIVDLSEATVTGWGENALLGVENVVGSRHDDTILGDRGANRLAGGPGDDEVDGGRQPLRYVCGRGNVRLEDHAADLVQGDAGDDVLRGAGPDRLNGGAGTDRCAGDQASDSCEVRVIPPPPPGPPAPVPATPHHDGRIAFVDEAGDLLSVRPDGSDRHMLFRASQRELFIDGPATWAPQGRRFVLTGDTGTAEHPIGHTYVFRSDGTEVRELHGISCCPQWAPDGTNLVFLCRSHLWLVGVGGSQAARLGAVEEYGGTLAPDGRSVAYPHHVIGRDGGHWEIWTMRPDGTGRKPLTRLGGFNDTPLWSPDGTRLLFIHEGKTQGRYAEVIDADGSRVRRLPIPTWDFAWAPDGRRIVYQAESGAILTSRLDGSDPVRVGVNRILGAADVSWQPGSPIHP